MSRTQTNIVIITFLVSLSSFILTSCDKIFPSKAPAKETPAVSASQTPTIVSEQSVPLPPNVLVRVGDWSLTQEQFDQRLKLLKEGLPDFDANKPGNKEAVLNELVRQELLVKDAQVQGISEQKDIVEAVDDFRRTLLVQELANRLTKNISATEKDAQAYYDQNKALFVDVVQYGAREIIAADEASAKNILVQLLQGGDFIAIAQAQSKGKTASKGGELPAFAKAPFEAMQTAMATLDVGGLSSVFKGPEGFYIVKLESKKGGQAKPFLSVKADLISGLTMRKQQEVILEHINQLAKKNKVEINKDLLGTAVSK